MRLFLAIFLCFAPSLDSLELMLYYSPTCPYSRKVLYYLQTIHKTIPMKDVSKDAQAKKELKEIRGPNIVPCLLIDETPLYDPNAIIDWLSNHKQDLLRP